MIWEEKPRRSESGNSGPFLNVADMVAQQLTVQPQSTGWQQPIRDKTPPFSASIQNQSQTVLGRSTVMQGDLTGSEELLIEGEFEGNINVKDSCLTIAAQGHVKGDICARDIIVFGSVNGKISAQNKIELRKTGHVIGDLLAGGMVVEEGAYLKGSIEILGEGMPKPESPGAAD